MGDAAEHVSNGSNSAHYCVFSSPPSIIREFSRMQDAVVDTIARFQFGSDHLEHFHELRLIDNFLLKRFF
jgi:hypothetical protein